MKVHGAYLQELKAKSRTIDIFSSTNQEHYT